MSTDLSKITSLWCEEWKGCFGNIPHQNNLYSWTNGISLLEKNLNTIKYVRIFNVIKRQSPTHQLLQILTVPITAFLNLERWYHSRELFLQKIYTLYAPQYSDLGYHWKQKLCDSGWCNVKKIGKGSNKGDIAWRQTFNCSVLMLHIFFASKYHPISCDRIKSD